MTPILDTAVVLVVGVIRRFYFWLPSFLLDPFDLYAEYVQPYTHREIDLPEALFPFVLVFGLLLAVVGAAADLRSQPGSTAVRFVPIDQDVSVSGLHRGREDTPCDRVELRVTGSLVNSQTERAPIDGIDVRVWQRRGRYAMWRSLARPATVGLTGLFGAVDPYYHGLHVGGHTRSRVVSGVHFPLQLPDEVKLRPRFRVALAVRTASRRNYGTTVAYFDLTEAIERGEAEHRRLIEMFPDRDDD